MSGRPPGSANWPEPRPEFLAALHDDIRADRRRLSTPRRRLALAAAISLVFLTSLAATGGVGQAGNGVREATEAVKQVLGTGSTPTNAERASSRRNGPDDDQYEEECERQARLAIRAERELHRENRATERERHREAMEAARETESKDDDRAERRLHRQNLKAESERHKAELKRLFGELRACDDGDDDDDDD